MQAVEGMTRVIAMADELMGLHPSHRLENQDPEQDQLAIAVCTAMLNAALPVAQYRVFVKIEDGYPANEVGSEFTICAVRVEDIVAALRLYGTTRRKMYITIFKQKEGSADMVSGYQGDTRGLGNRYDKWLKGLNDAIAEL